MTGWQDIGTAKRDGSLVLCMREGWPEPALLVWKTNPRLEGKEAEMGLNASYFGDPVELDDYDLAKPGAGPTHYLPIPAFNVRVAA